MAISISRRPSPAQGSGYSIGLDSSPQWITGAADEDSRRAARAARQDAVGVAVSAKEASHYDSLRVATARTRATRLAPFSASLLFVAALLVAGGLIVAYSASQVTSELTNGDPNALFLHQVLFVGVGCVFALAAAWLPMEYVRAHVGHIMAFSVLLLALVPLVGHAAFGAQRWLEVGNTTFQPSELAKLALALFFANWLTLKGDKLDTLQKGLFPYSVITAFVLVLIWLENDLGTIVVVFIVAVAMFCAAGARLGHLLIIAAIGAAGAGIITMVTPFRRARLEAFLHPLSPGCTDSTSYHICHAVVSLMSGGLFGRGLGDGLAKASYLPNAATDSIFAVVGEELGLVGCFVVLACFVALAVVGFRVGRRAHSAFDALLACGITCWLVVQAALNIGSVVGGIPFTGVPLPFFSIGGSSLVVSLAAVGLLLNISRRTQPQDVAV